MKNHGMQAKNVEKSTAPAQTARKAPCDDGVRAIQKIYRQFIKVSDGAEGGVVGLNGSIRPKYLARLCAAGDGGAAGEPLGAGGGGAAGELLGAG